tara:strand:+ start:497 stop:646 length:150 start_codon:yes stop_codon:yes gene_type:complete
MKKEKNKKGIIKNSSIKQHYIRTVLNYDKYDNIVEEIIKEKMGKKGVKK